MKTKPARTKKPAAVKPTLKSVQLNMVEILKNIEALRQEFTRIEALNTELDNLFRHVASNTLELEELSLTQNTNSKLAIVAIALSVIAFLCVIFF